MIAPARRSRAFTLVETMIAASVFLMVLVITVAVWSIGSKADQNMSLQDDVYRQAIQAAEHMHDEFLSALVTKISSPPDDPASNPSIIEYRKLRYNPTSDVPASDFQGLPSWETEIRTIKVENGLLMLTSESGVRRLLARLGNEGFVRFEQTSGTQAPPVPNDPRVETEFFWPSDMLKVTIHSEISSPNGTERNAAYEMTVRFFLRNQDLR